MINREKYIGILKRYLDGNISREEHDELFALTSKEDVDPILAEMIDSELNGKLSTGADLPPHISEEIIRNILISEKHTTKVLKVSTPGRKYRAAAASIFVLILASVYFFTVGDRSSGLTKAEASAPKTNLEKTNNTSSPFTLLLGDGTMVVLQPGATINYPVDFTLNKREVYLKGEAFFHVSRNPARPFNVYYNDIVTQVLGTSFSLKTNPFTNNVEVTVKEGKVQVYENNTLLAKKEKVKGVIITQNQKVIYYKDQRAFETTLSDSLQPITAEGSKDKARNEEIQQDFNYREPVNLQEIFTHLQTTYGIEIVVESEHMYTCLFTGDLSRQDLYKKLEIICLTVDAHYEVKGTRILVSGKGCN